MPDLAPSHKENEDAHRCPGCGRHVYEVHAVLGAPDRFPPTMGLDPVTAGLAAQVGQTLLSSLFSPARAAGPSQAELAAAAAMAKAERDRNLILGVSLIGAALLGVVMLRRR